MVEDVEVLVVDFLEFGDDVEDMGEDVDDSGCGDCSGSDCSGSDWGDCGDCGDVCILPCFVFVSLSVCMLISPSSLSIDVECVSVSFLFSLFSGSNIRMAKIRKNKAN